MKNPLVSIIIPFYNEELYLLRAIKSVINQTYQNIEIILIDDGSKDSSNSIALPFSEKYSYCKLLTIENSGLSIARNIGLENCIGDYLIFLDADDELLPKMIELLLYNCLKVNSDIVICKFDLINTKGHKLSSQGYKNISSDYISKNEACFAMYTNNIPVTVWGKLYRKSVVESIRFPKGLWFEDRPYLLQSFFNSSRISFVDKSLLKIHLRKNSITRKIVEPKRIIDQHKIYEKEMLLTRQGKYFELSKTIVDFHLSVLVDTFFLLIIDVRQIDNINNIRLLYLDYIVKYKKHYKQHNYSLKLKKHLLLVLIELPRFLPWSLVNFMIENILKKRYKATRLLKDS